MKSLKKSADLLAEQVTKGRVPSTVTFQITDRCNYSCSHCYQEHEGIDELSLSEIEGILVQLADAGVLFLTFMGGEFFMHRDADEILRKAHDLGFAIKLLTTGHHIHEKRADFLATVRPLQVDISIYGSKPAAHEQVTNQAGSWERSIAAVKKLVLRKIPVVLKTPVMACNVDELKGISALAEDLGATFTFDPKVTAVENGDLSSTMMRMSGEQNAKLYQEPDVRDFLATSYEKAQTQDLRPLHHAPCRAGQDLCSISSTGEVWPCSNLPVAVGDLRKQSFISIWQESASLEEVRSLTWATISECNRCPVRSYCGRCSGMALVEHGDMKGASLEACRQAVAVRDSLRIRKLIPETETSLPPTWSRVNQDGLHHIRGKRSPLLRVLA